VNERPSERSNECVAYLQVRVTGAPRVNGTITVYRSNGTALRVRPSELVHVDRVARCNTSSQSAWADARWYTR
jgi:hypothetical protein